jgi:2-oxoglutarate dehydrogenase E1 component
VTINLNKWSAWNLKHDVEQRVQGLWKREVKRAEGDGDIDPATAKRVVFCSGKVFFDLRAARREAGVKDVALVRISQLYPFPHKAFAAEMKRFPNATEVVWCQDEPQNQGAWFFVQHYVHENMLEGQKLGYAGRPASASPAVGYSHLHQEQQKALLDQAFGKLKGFVLTK